MTTGKTDRNYYCSMKFRFLKIDLGSKTTYNCHAARPHDIDFKWLSDNPGQLFNTPVNVMERNMMLANQRNSSCEQNCWAAEDAGAVSPRIYQGGPPKTHTESNTTPEIIDLTIGTDCNFTCSYCCKEFSNSWSRDLLNNGNYDIDSEPDRFTLTPVDKIRLKISQPKLKSTKHYQASLNEIKLAAPNLKKLQITGGEPFLDNQLIEIIADIPFRDDTEIQLYTGLGVSNTRFENILNKIKSIKNFYLTISAECIGKLHEFNRYGSSWTDFEKKLQLIRKYGIPYEFQSTISNLTVFGFPEFYNQFKDDKIVVTFAYQPNMMAPYVLDYKSKQLVLKQLKSMPDIIKNPIEQSLSKEPTELQRQEIGKFLKEFVRRRKDLDVNAYPEHFLKWMGYVV